MAFTGGSVDKGGTGQAQGLPLPDRFGGILLARHFALATLLGKNEQGG